MSQLTCCDESRGKRRLVGLALMVVLQWFALSLLLWVCQMNSTPEHLATWVIAIMGWTFLG